MISQLDHPINDEADIRWKLLHTFTQKLHSTNDSFMSFVPSAAISAFYTKYLKISIYEHIIAAFPSLPRCTSKMQFWILHNNVLLTFLKALKNKYKNHTWIFKYDQRSDSVKRVKLSVPVALHQLVKSLH